MWVVRFAEATPLKYHGLAEVAHCTTEEALAAARRALVPRRRRRGARARNRGRARALARARLEKPWWRWSSARSPRSTRAWCPAGRGTPPPAGPVRGCDSLPARAMLLP